MARVPGSGSPRLRTRPRRAPLRARMPHDAASLLLVPILGRARSRPRPAPRQAYDARHLPGVTSARPTGPPGPQAVSVAPRGAPEPPAVPVVPTALVEPYATQVAPPEPPAVPVAGPCRPPGRRTAVRRSSP